MLSSGHYQVINTPWPWFINVAVQMLTANNELLALWCHLQRSHAVNKMVDIPKAYYHMLLCNMQTSSITMVSSCSLPRGLNLQQLFQHQLFSDLQTSPTSSQFLSMWWTKWNRLYVIDCFSKRDLVSWYWPSVSVCVNWGEQLSCNSWNAHYTHLRLLC